MYKWTDADMPRQDRKLVVVTGTGGLGYETALSFAKAGATVVLAGRNRAKGDESVARIAKALPEAEITFGQIDLADLASIDTFAGAFSQQHPQLDFLINNAGVMTPPERRETADGFELQFGTNYLGHFALTGRLLPLLRASSRPVIVNVSSLAHRQGAIHFDDLQWTRRYRTWASYAQSKIAMLMFSIELDRRARKARWNLQANAAHPGFARTELIANGPGETGVWAQFNKRFMKPLFSHSAHDGALPTLFAATSDQADGGKYYGPDGFYELKGPVKDAYVLPAAQDPDVARRLWTISEELTGVQISI
jgi:NAD(P)-dependent dehydrogenase (short-subunit alcohol dehydrogenase family)